MGIVVTELPYLVGPEKVIEKIKDNVQSKKLQGISDVKDLTDRKHGLRLVIEIKNGFNPEAVLEQLYKLTPMEDNFAINNVTLVDGQPRTLGLKELLRVYVDFRTDVVRRRSEFRLRKRKDRLHLVEGLLIAILDIDEVIQVIRTSDDAGAAKARLMDVFDLSDPQATYILDLQLRRLTKFSKIELENEKAELERQIEELEAILGDEKLLLRTVSNELAEVAKAHGTPRRTVLLESAGSPVSAATPLEVADDPCWVLLSSTWSPAPPPPTDPRRGQPLQARRARRGRAHDRTRRGRSGHLPRPDGAAVRAGPPDPAAHQRLPSLSGGARWRPTSTCRPARSPHDRLARPAVARPRARHRDRRGQAGHPRPRQGRLRGHLPQGRRHRGGCRPLRTGEDLVFITSDAQLLRFSAGAVRPQGRGGGGIAGIKVGRPAGRVLRRGRPCRRRRGRHLLRVLRALPGTEAGSSRRRRMPSTRRRGAPPVGCAATASSRARTRSSSPGPARPARAAAANGVALELPPAVGKRDGSGSPRRPRSRASPDPRRRRVTNGASARTSAGHGTSAPDACSVQLRRADVSAYGTAARAEFWLAVEQTGPWGRSAATESHLPADLGRQLDEECSRRGGRLSLLRAPGPHADAHHRADARHTRVLRSRPWLLVAREVTPGNSRRWTRRPRRGRCEGVRRPSAGRRG